MKTATLGPAILCTCLLGLQASSAAGAQQPAGAVTFETRDPKEYDAVCAFIEKLEDQAKKVIAQQGNAARDRRIGEAADGGQMVRYREAGLAIEYLKTGDGRMLISSADMAASYLKQQSIDEAALARALPPSLPRPLPGKLQLGCDMLELLIRSKHGTLRSMKLLTHID
jgi:hypothetical protein